MKGIESFIDTEKYNTYPLLIKDLEWKKSFITKAKQFERDVIPVHISGKNSSFFYQLANFRKFLKIRANIEMFFLVNFVLIENFTYVSSGLPR